MLIDGLHKAPLTSSGRSLPHPHALLLSLIVSSFRPCLGGAQSTAYQKLAFCPGLTSGHIPISPVSRELDFATRAGGKFIVSRAGEALRCTSEKSKSEIPAENPWR